LSTGSDEASAVTSGVGPARAPDSAFGKVVDGFNAVGGVLIFLVMLLTVADVFARNALGRPIDGVSELIGSAVIMIVFTQLASTLRHGRMSRAELFIEPLIARRPRAGHLLQAVFGVVGALVCAVLVYATWPKLVYAWTTDEFMGVEGIFTAPMWPMRLCVVLGAALTLVQYLVLVHRDLSIASGRSTGAPAR
jgi:TRAP-type mannitol/chloroaromatic compound transport system permease small subunit